MLSNYLRDVFYRVYFLYVEIYKLTRMLTIVELKTTCTLFLTNARQYIFIPQIFTFSNLKLDMEVHIFIVLIFLKLLEAGNVPMLV